MTSANSANAQRQSKIAAASGWIGSALEYYDFFIYATAASLVFPQIFFPSQNPTVAIVASLATYGVGYVARPIGAFVLGHWGDTHGRKNVLVLCMFLMGFSTMLVGVLPTYAACRIMGAGASGRAAADPGFCGRRRDLRRKLDDARACALWPARLLCELHAAGRAGRTDPRSGGIPSARDLHAEGRFHRLGLAHPVPAELRRHRRRLPHPPRGRGDAGVRRGERGRRGAESADRPGLQDQLGTTCCGSSAWR